MKKKSTQKWAILTVALLVITSMVTVNLTKHKSMSRAEYEQYLSSEKQKVTIYSKEQLADIPKPTHPDQAALQNYFMTFDPEEQRVPLERLREAYQNTRDLQHSSLKSGVSPFEWEFTPSNMGGRTRAFIWDPNE